MFSSAQTPCGARPRSSRHRRSRVARARPLQELVQTNHPWSCFGWRHGLGEGKTTLRVAGYGRGMASGKGRRRCASPDTGEAWPRGREDDAARRRIRARHGLGEGKTTLRVAGYGRGMASGKGRRRCASPDTGEAWPRPYSYKWQATTRAASSCPCPLASRGRSAGRSRRHLAITSGHLLAKGQAFPSPVGDGISP